MTTTQELTSLAVRLSGYATVKHYEAHIPFVVREDCKRARDALEDLQAEKREHESACSVAEELAQQYRKERDQALARLVELEKQEPIGHLDERGELGEFMPVELRASHIERNSSTPRSFTIPVYAAAGASPVEPSQSTEPDMPAICAALGFDTTNHHNAARCPYCTPSTREQPSQERELSDTQLLDYLQSTQDGLVVCQHEERSQKTDGSNDYNIRMVFDGWTTHSLFREEEKPTVRDAIIAAINAKGQS